MKHVPGGPEDYPQFKALVDDVMAGLVEHLPDREKQSAAHRLAYLKGRHEVTEAGWLCYLIPGDDREQKAKRAMRARVQGVLRELRTHEGGARS